MGCGRTLTSRAGCGGLARSLVEGRAGRPCADCFSKTSSCGLKTAKKGLLPISQIYIRLECDPTRMTVVRLAMHNLLVGMVKRVFEDDHLAWLIRGCAESGELEPREIAGQSRIITWDCGGSGSPSHRCPRVSGNSSALAKRKLTWMAPAPRCLRRRLAGSLSSRGPARHYRPSGRKRGSSECRESTVPLCTDRHSCL